MDLEKQIQTQPKQDTSILALINKQLPQFKMALGKSIDPERFTRIAMTIVRTNPTLAQCSAPSLLGALMVSAQLALEPNTPLGQAYIIPRKNQGVWEANFQIGYKGFLKLFYNVHGTEFAYAKEVHANDQFSYQFGANPDIQHKPSTGDRGPVIYVYAVAKFFGKTPLFEVMTVGEIDEHAKRFSQTYAKSFSPWKTHWNEMAKKTVLKRLLQICPLSTESASHVAIDETTRKLDDNTIDVTDFQVMEKPYLDTEIQAAKDSYPAEYEAAVKEVGDPAIRDNAERIIIRIEEMVAANA